MNKFNEKKISIITIISLPIDLTKLKIFNFLKKKILLNLLNLLMSTKNNYFTSLSGHTTIIIIIIIFEKSQNIQV